MELETAVESMSMTTVEGTTPAIAVAASSPDTLALAAQCPFIQQIVVLTGDAQAVSNTLAPFMALANSTTAPRTFHHRARMAVAGVASFQPGTGDIEIAPQSPEPVHVPVAGAESPAGQEEAVMEEGPVAPASAPEEEKGTPEAEPATRRTPEPQQAAKQTPHPEEAGRGLKQPSKAPGPGEANGADKGDGAEQQAPKEETSAAADPAEKTKESWHAV
ncbi:g5911 [Coccomyxa elongata]